MGPFGDMHAAEEDVSGTTANDDDALPAEKTLATATVAGTDASKTGEAKEPQDDEAGDTNVTEEDIRNIRSRLDVLGGPEFLSATSSAERTELVDMVSLGLSET